MLFSKTCQLSAFWKEIADVLIIKGLIAVTQNSSASSLSEPLQNASSFLLGINRRRLRSENVFKRKKEESVKLDQLCEAFWACVNELCRVKDSVMSRIKVVNVK